MSSAISVTGTVDSESLGLTSAHEHVLIDASVWASLPPGLPASVADSPVDITILGELTRNPVELNADNYRLDDVALAVAELRRFRAWGGRTVVELTNAGLGQDPGGLVRASVESGVTIIAGCGFYVAPTHPAYVASASVDELATYLLTEVNDGLRGTGVRPGIIGELGTSPVLHSDEIKVLRAAALVQQATGLTIVVHSYLWSQNGMEIAAILESAGATLARVAIAHLDNAPIDMTYHLALADRGLLLSYDGFGNEWYVDSHKTWFPRDTERLVAIRKLIEAGHASQILIGRDICRKIQLLRYGGWGYEHIARSVPEMMRWFGFSDQEIEGLLIDNPRRMLEIPGR